MVKLGLLFGLLWVSAASAANLKYETRPNDLACPTATRFAEEVTAKLGFSPWREDGVVVEVRIEATNGRYHGRLVSTRDRERTFRADTCRRVVDLLVTATSIALDRPEPGRAFAADAPARRNRGYATPTRVATADSPPPREGELVLPANPATEWAFASRNNDFQVGVGFDSIAGSVIASGAIPLGRGHFDLGIGRRSNTVLDSVTMSQTHVSARYMWPVFYINRNSSFEVPIYAGGGAAHAWWSTTGNAMNDSSDSKLIPELAVSQAVQLRKLPVEFMLAMMLALAEPPSGGSSFGIEVGLRYVFRGK